MDQFFHIRMLFSMIVSLSLAHLLKGVAKIIEHPTRLKIYWVHLLWVLFVFLQIVDFWWWELHLKNVAAWNFGFYLYIVLYIITFYILCSLLFPDDMKEYTGYKDYYFSRRGWIFSLLGLTLLLDIGDTLLKGADYYAKLGTEYPIRIALLFTLCIIGIRTKKEWYHAAMVIAFLLYGISWTLRKYLTQ